MEKGLKNFRLIETFSPDLGLYNEVHSNLNYTIKTSGKTDANKVSRMNQELHFLQSYKIFHKNIISVINYSETAEFIHTFFEPCPEGPLISCPKLDILSLFLQICEGVSYLHKKSITIKSLSTHSILLQGHIPKISNLEWASQESSNLSGVLIENYWKAPEVLESQSNYSQKSDIWNLGLIFFYLVFRLQYQFEIPETKPEYKIILGMTLDANPNTRSSIQVLLNKLYEYVVQKPHMSESCSCFSLGLFGHSKSTKSIVKSILKNDLKHTKDLNLTNLLRKIEKSPEKIQKFFIELQNHTRFMNGTVKIRALSMLFAYLKRAPLIAFTQDPGIFSLLLNISQKNSQQEGNEETKQTIQGLIQIILIKYYVIKVNIPRITGSFNKDIDCKIEYHDIILAYWENLQVFLELLHGCRLETRVLRLWINEEQVNVFKLLSQLDSATFDERLKNLEDNAEVLFIKDSLKFPRSDKKPAKILNNAEVNPENEEMKSEVLVTNETKKLSKDCSYNTIYKTANNELRFEKIDLDSPEYNSKSNNSGINETKLVYKQRIGNGSSCEVWLGSYLSKKVAIKKQKSFDRVSETEFKRELQALQSLSHRNLVNCIGAVFSIPQCLILEYCSGGDLFKLLHERKDVYLSWPQRIQILKDICQGMEYLHSNSYIHRDLKPLNLLLNTPISNENDPVHVKISDFGLTRLCSDDEYMTGMLGTCHWMAPEVLISSKYTQKADVYSFSIILYEVITREYPYRGIRPNQICEKVIKENLRPDIEILPDDCPRVLISLMKLCWNSNYEVRPTFTNILQILESINFG